MRISIRQWIVAVAVVAASLCGGMVSHALAFEPNASESMTDDSVAQFASYGADSGGCDDSCCDDCCETKLLGFIKPSDQCFVDFISPITNQYYFEDPRNLSELRFIFAHHVLPNRAPLVGGDAQLFVVHARAALTDRLSLIATKDGFLVTGADPVIVDDGWMDVSLGLKYNLYADPEAQQLVSAGIRYELPIGSPQTLQGNGDGVFDFFLTGGTAFGCYGHWISSAGFWIPADSQAESQAFYWSNHWDWQINGSRVYALTEVNWYHWMRSGAGGVPGLEGLDVINLGSTGVAGNDIVTGAVGAKYKHSAYSELGFAWEVPLTDRRDIIDNRLTIDYILRY